MFLVRCIQMHILKTIGSMDGNGSYDKTNAVAISCGKEHTAILLNTGEVMTVGRNNFRVLGRDIGSAYHSITIGSMDPAGNYTGSNAIAISCGQHHTAILLNTGEVMMVGNNSNGQLGKVDVFYRTGFIFFNYC